METTLKKLKGVSKSQSKHIKFEGHKNCLIGEKYQRECDTHLLLSINHQMHLQKVKKNQHFLCSKKNDVM